MKSKKPAFKQFFEIIPDPGCILNQDGSFEMVNPAWQELLGYSNSELIGEQLSRLVHPGDMGVIAENILDAADWGKSCKFTHRLRTKKGEYKNLEWHISPTQDDGRRYATVREVSAYPPRSAELESAKERDRWAMEASMIGVWDWDLRTKEAFYSPTYFTMLGYPTGEMPGHIRNWLDLIHPEDRERTLQANQECIENRCERFDVEFRMLNQSGEWRWIIAKGKTVERDATGRALRMIGTHADITERRQIEESLRRSQEDFKGYFNIGTIGMCVTSIEKGWIEVNDHLCQMFGYTRDELHPLSWPELTHPDDLSLDLDLFNETLAGKRNTYQLEKRFIRKDGGIVYTSLFVSCSRNKDGSVRYFLAMIVDITERKLAEEALKESQEKFSKAFQYAPILFTISDINNGLFLDVNDEFLRISGFSRAEVIGKTSIELGWISPEDRLRLFQMMQTHGRVHEMELTLHAKDGHRVQCLYLGELIYVKGQTCLLSIAKDITNQKQAEITLQESEMSFRTIFEKSSTGYLQVSTEGKLLKVNAAMATMLGYTIEELTQVKFNDVTHPEDQAISMQVFQDQLSGERETFQFEKRYLHRDGHTIWAFVSSTLVRDGHGTPLYSITNVTDITERKHFEDALRESQSRYQMVFENSGTANSIFDTSCQLILQNELSRQSLGVKGNQAFGKTALEIFGPELGPIVTERMQHVLATGKTGVFETSFNLPVGKKWYRSTYQTAFDEKQNLVGVQVISQDITERKDAEEQIKKSLAEKETLLRELYHRTKNNMAVIIALLDLQSMYVDDHRLQKEFLEAQNRIRSMALVHQKLYDASDLSRINLKDYIHDLLTLLMQSYNISPGRINVQAVMDDTLVLIDTAIPCGLILNELISNTLKYAFKLDTEGEIRIGLRRTEEGEIRINFADNGVGVPPGFDFHRDGHLGIQNIYILVENQLRGKIRFESMQGVQCQITFQDIFYQPRI